VTFPSPTCHGRHADEAEFISQTFPRVIEAWYRVPDALELYSCSNLSTLVTGRKAKDLGLDLELAKVFPALIISCPSLSGEVSLLLRSHFSGFLVRGVWERRNLGSRSTYPGLKVNTSIDRQGKMPVTNHIILVVTSKAVWSF
jgi:hypothetical protein